MLAASEPSWSARTTVAGSSGFIVTGGVESAPGAQLWSQSSDVPRGQATTATLFPGGVLLSDGTTSWYGRATTR